MRTNLVPRRNKTAKALLSIYDAKESLRKDQKLFHKTLSDLKSRLNFISKKKEGDISSSNRQKVF
jgi:hypothetical protein